MTSLMQRKARTGRDVQAARAMSLGRALRLTAAKQAEQLMGLAMSAVGVTRRSVTVDQVPASLDPASLILLMDGPGNRVGAVVLDPAFVTGIIQQQIMGKLTPAPADAELRPHTPTDAALCAPFIEGLLSRAGPLADDEADRELLKGYRFGVWAKAPRQAQLVLDAADYDVIEMTLDLAAGISTGKLVMILPSLTSGTLKVPEDAEAAEVPSKPQNLSKNVFGLHAELTIALTRMKMPLQRVSAFKVGDVIDLDLTSMARALVIDGNGRAISRGTLGQVDGMRALQVEQRTAKHHTQPRRRAADRGDLDLPDVTQDRREDAAHQPASFMEEMETSDLPSMADIDVFGDLSDLPELPDIDEAAEAADAKMAEFDTTEFPEDDLGDQARSGW